MRALTVHQPYASLIMAGVKPVENRKRPVPSTLPQWGECEYHGRIPPGEWWTDEGGVVEVMRHQLWGRDLCTVQKTDGPFPFRLGIHAAKKDPDSHPWPRIAYEAIQHGDGLPTGVLLGTVLVTGCHWHGDCFGLQYADRRRPPMKAVWCSKWAEADRYHITLTDPQPLPEPIPMRGYQGWWTLPVDVPALGEAVAR